MHARWRPQTAPSAAETAPRAAAGCLATAAARLVAMAAPAPPCAVSPNARDSVRAGGATAADARPMATSNGAERRRDGAASRSRVSRDRHREARGDGGASAGLRRRHDRPALGTCGGGGRLERDDRGGEAVHARTSCSRLERARMRAVGERGRPGRALGPSRVAQHAQSADPLGGRNAIRIEIRKRRGERRRTHLRFDLPAENIRFRQ